MRDLLRLFPGPSAHVPLQGLYLSEPYGPPQRPPTRLVYANFITSLDGRIALPDPQRGRSTVPPAIANARDWHLFQQLAAAADALITTGSHVRDLRRAVTSRSFPVSGKPEFAALLDWRRARGLTPQPAVVIATASLDLPRLDALAASGRNVYVATGRAADPRKTAALEAQGVRVLRVGDGAYAEGGRLIEALMQEGHANIAMIGGGEVLHALLVDDAIDRLYLTLACRLLGGLSFDTLLTGPVLESGGARFKLAALHYDAAEGSHSTEQLFAVLDRALGILGR